MSYSKFEDLVSIILILLLLGAFTLAKMLVFKKGSVKIKVIFVSIITLIGIIYVIYDYLSP
jgi:hypothetical protein